VDSEIASEQAYSVIYKPPGHQSSSRDPTEGQGSARLSRIVSAITITLLSVALWTAIWAAASSVAAVWLR
jgi:hypothetical protein